MSSTLIAVGEDASPARDKAAGRGVYGGRLLHRRFRLLVGCRRAKLLFSLCAVSFVIMFSSRISPFMGWNPHYPSSVFSPSRAGYTVLINMWKQNSVLKQSVAHYASCSGTDAIHVVWSESDLPSDSLKAFLKKIVLVKSQTVRKPNFKFDLNEEDNSNNRFKPIKDLRTDAIFSVDDDVIVPCDTLDFAFAVWQSAPLTMVGFVPRMHWLAQEFWHVVAKAKYFSIALGPCRNGLNNNLFPIMRLDPSEPLTEIQNSHFKWHPFHVIAEINSLGSLPFHYKSSISYYKYGGWWSVWWMGTYSMVLTKAAFFHRTYLDLYTHEMPSSIHDYITRERNCEDIAMSLLVANITNAPPIWVKGKIHDIGTSGISSLRGHSNTRNKCLNDLISLFGMMPLASTKAKAVDARRGWFW